MKFFGSLSRLWSHRRFRRLFVLRIATQGADATLLVGMAAYLLFSPQQQPDAMSIALILTATLLPFCLVGPFVSVVLDRVLRRDIFVVVDVARALLALGIAATVWFGGRSLTGALGLFALLLVTMSLNRFLLAGLSAALPSTISDDEFLDANAVMPIVGPLGAALAGVALGVRFALGGYAPEVGDAAVFCCSAALFAVSAVLALGFGRRDLGPEQVRRSRLVDVARDLGQTLRHLRRTPPASVALATIGFQRIGLGIIQIGVILIFRNRIDAGHLPVALADIGAWAGLTTLGFVTASVLTPQLVSRWGVRSSIIGALCAAAVIQLWPGSWFERFALLAAAFGLGLTAQVLKIGVDTVIQAHVDESHKGRTFVIYDMIFNLANVIAAWISVALLPADGGSLPVFVGIALLFLSVAMSFALTTAGHKQAFERGTEALTGPKPTR